MDTERLLILVDMPLLSFNRSATDALSFHCVCWCSKAANRCVVCDLCVSRMPKLVSCATYFFR